MKSYVLLPLCVLLLSTGLVNGHFPNIFENVKKSVSDLAVGARNALHFSFNRQNNNGAGSAIVFREEIDNRPHFQPQNQPQLQPQNKPQILPQIQPQNKPQIQPQLQPQNIPQIQPQLQPQIQPQLQPQIEPQLQPQVQPQLQPQIQHQPKAQEGAITFAEDLNTSRSGKVGVDQVVSTTPQNDSKNKTGEQDGRQNFAGGCLPGFSLTRDGRCKEAF